MRAKKSGKKLFYEKLRHVPGRRLLLKSENKKSKPVRYLKLVFFAVKFFFHETEFFILAINLVRK